MNARILVVTVAASVAACTVPPAPPATPATPAATVAADPGPRPGRLWNLERERCEQLLAISDDDRSYAAMFYYGYVAARAGIRVIDGAQVEARIARAVEECAAHPTTSIPDAFRRALVPQRRPSPARS